MTDVQLTETLEHECPAARAITVNAGDEWVVIGAGILDEPCLDVYGCGRTTREVWLDFIVNYCAALNRLVDESR